MTIETESETPFQICARKALFHPAFDELCRDQEWLLNVFRLDPAQLDQHQKRLKEKFKVSKETLIKQLKISRNFAEVTIGHDVKAKLIEENGPWCSKLPLNRDCTWIDPTTFSLDQILKNSLKLGLNLRAGRPQWFEAPPWRKLGVDKDLTDEDHHFCRSWLNEAWHLDYHTTHVAQALEALAWRKRFDPIQTWLRNLPPWDGRRRIDRLFACYYGAEDNEYTKALGRRFILMLINRALRPGCKQDHIVVIQGAQGAGKSTGLETLVGKGFYCDSPVAVDPKDVERYNLAWIVEWGELSGIRKRENERIKQFLSSESEVFRAAYARRSRKVLKRFVVVGTTNEDAYLSDPTGNRRWLPVQSHGVLLGEIERDREQLFAEGLVAFHAREQYWFEKDEFPELEAAREAVYEHDPWAETIKKVVEKRLEEAGFVRLSQIWAALDIEIAQQHRADERRITGELKRLGLISVVKRFASGRQRVWIRPKAKASAKAKTKAFAKLEAHKKGRGPR